MKKKIILVITLVLFCINICVNISLVAQKAIAPITNPKTTEETITKDQSTDNASTTTKPVKPAKEKSTDWFSIIIASTFMLGLFALFPLVIFTNVKEKLNLTPKSNAEIEDFINSLSMEERNQRAYEILESIENKLSTVPGEDGSDLLTITKGSQARYVRNGLEYIATYLQPDNQELTEQMNAIKEVYDNRTERYFAGSKWILGCAIAIPVVAVFIDFSSLWSSLMLLHFCGIAFYYLASRVPAYILEKRLRIFGSKGKGLVGVIMTSLFAGSATKHYVSINGGPWKRDYDEEFSSNMTFLMIATIIAFLIGVFVAIFGVINFILNYSTNFILPFKSCKQWYDKTFIEQPMAITA